mmetsp:Transcript_14435/g.27734  ORF Transcript_14435/g.27734 Transcript_14435/m.27734 type:complete len:146 (+) Transcript_14435:300-737(+)
MVSPALFLSFATLIVAHITLSAAYTPLSFCHMHLPLGESTINQKGVQVFGRCSPSQDNTVEIQFNATVAWRKKYKMDLLPDCQTKLVGFLCNQCHPLTQETISRSTASNQNWQMCNSDCNKPSAVCLTQQLSVGYVSGQRFKFCC